MKNTGHVVFWDTPCIFIEESNSISLIPQNKDDIKNIQPHLHDQNFIFIYSDFLGFKSIAFIERMQFEINHTITLFPHYTISQCHLDYFTGFEIKGEALDDFFSPSHYFYNHFQKGIKTNTDFLYHHEVADEWTVLFEDKILIIALTYGDILKWGIASDLMLHPKLKVSFEKTSDIHYIYRVYSFIIRFLQIIRYNSTCGKLQIDLYNDENGKMVYNGRFNQKRTDESPYSKRGNEVEYGYYKPYIQQFLQFSANNPEYTVYHYPTNETRFRGNHYSAVDLLNIFSSFESECYANKTLYENIDSSKIQSIKDILVSQLDIYPQKELCQEELDFLKNAKNRILQLGTQFGQTQKIINAYQILHNALDNSIKNIFYLPEFRLTGPLQEDSLRKISRFLVKQRGSIAHGGFSGIFSDIDAQKIRFLEILTYAQLLKRIGLEDPDIERVIGIIFGCNFILFHERYFSHTTEKGDMNE